VGIHKVVGNNSFDGGLGIPDGGDKGTGVQLGSRGDNPRCLPQKWLRRGRTSQLSLIYLVDYGNRHCTLPLLLGNTVCPSHVCFLNLSLTLRAGSGGPPAPETTGGTTISPPTSASVAAGLGQTTVVVGRERVVTVME